MKTLVTFLFTTTIASAAWAETPEDTQAVFPQQLSAQELLVFCASSTLTRKGRQRRGYCDGFISGIEEALRVHSLQHPSPITQTICVPAGTNSRAMSEAFIRHASRKDVALERPAAAVVIEALGSAFGC